MTLVLGACVADAVVLGADSKVWIDHFDEKTMAHVGSTTGVDRKLFKLARVGIATYGAAAEHIPTVLASELRMEWTVNDVVTFLRERFKQHDQMHALVGGLDEKGNPILFDVPMTGTSPQQLTDTLAKPPRLALRGLRSGPVNLESPGTIASCIEQMLSIFAESSGPHVGPPFEFLVVRRSV